MGPQNVYGVMAVPTVLKELPHAHIVQRVKDLMCISRQLSKKRVTAFVKTVHRESIVMVLGVVYPVRLALIHPLLQLLNAYSVCILITKTKVLQAPASTVPLRAATDFQGHQTRAEVPLQAHASVSKAIMSLAPVVFHARKANFPIRKMWQHVLTVRVDFIQSIPETLRVKPVVVHRDNPMHQVWHAVELQRAHVV
jgi:hypothetical protein